MNNQIETYGDVSEAEIAQAARTLAKFKGGYLPFPLFLEVSRLTVSAIVEVVPCRRTADGQVEVLLTRRSEDDLLWPGQWHNPGTVLRPTDTPYTFDEAFQRVCLKELQLADMPELHYVQDIVHPTLRGMDLARIYFVEIADSAVGTFFPANALPDDTIPANKEVIQLGAAAFARHASLKSSAHSE